MVVLTIISSILFYIKQNPQRSSAPTTSTAQPEKANITGWKQFVNQQVGYSLEIPNSWSSNVDIAKGDATFTDNKARNSLLNHVDFFPGATVNDASLSEDPSNPLMSTITVQNPMAILSQEAYSAYYGRGLEGIKVSPSMSGAVYTTIDHHSALLHTFKNPIDPPQGTENAFCSECTSKEYLIDLGNGKILAISAIWGKDRSDIESLFDKVVNSLRFVKP